MSAEASVAERTKIECGEIKAEEAIFNALLEAYNAVRREDIGSFYSIEATLCEARGKRNSLTAVQQTAVDGLLGRIEGHPSYQSMVRESAYPSFESRVSACGKYRGHLAAVNNVIDGINHWRTTPGEVDAYSRVLSSAMFFLEQEGAHLPWGRMNELIHRIALAREGLPGRSDYKR